MPWSLRMVLYASTLLLLFVTYFGFRYFKSIHFLDLQPLWMWRSFFFILVILFFAYPVLGLFEYWFQNAFSRTSYPRFLIYLFWYGLVVSGVMLNWLILHDILLPIVVKLSGYEKESVRLLFSRSFLILAALTFIYTGAKMVWDTNRMIVEEIEFDVSREQISGDLAPLTIVHFSDLHADVFTDAAKMDQYIRLVNQANPDLVLFTGDLITSGIGHVQEGAEALQNIQSTYGVYAVLGDHDFWAGTDPIVNALEERGIPVLQNENVSLNHQGVPISITGVTEIYSFHLDNEELRSLVYEGESEGLKIVTSHQVTDRLIQFSRESDTNILLSGHTHGGQVRIPVFFYPFTAVRSETPYVNGNWRLGEMLLNVNSGLGFTLSPVRYNAPAQVSVIRVR